MTIIVDVVGRQILDSRGNPTVEVEVELESGAAGRRGALGRFDREFEAVELRDGGEEYGGKSVRQAVDNVNNEIAEELLGLDATDQRIVDQTDRPRTARPTRPSSAPTPCIRSLAGRSPCRRGSHGACPSTSTSAAATRTSCRCR